jgi:hypothetical protein
MLKLTSQQIQTATQALHEIEMMENAKDCVADVVVRVDLAFARSAKTSKDPLGLRGLMDYTIPAASVRAEIDTRLAAAHAALREIGVELIPG